MSDIGSFESLIEETKSEEIIEVKAKANFLISQNHVIDKKVAIVGVDDLIVVDMPDALLITSKEKTQKVKYVVNILKEKDKEKIKHHSKVYRSWGSYEVLVDEDKYKLKRIVKTGKKTFTSKTFS